MKRTLAGVILALLAPVAMAAAATVTPTLSSGPVSGTWYGPVSVSWTADPPYVPNPVSDAFTEGHAVTRATQACDPLNLLDCIAGSVSLDVDLSGPDITITRPKGTYQYAEQPVTAIYDCSDALSGMDPGPPPKGPGTSCDAIVASSAPLPVYPGGTDQTFTVTAKDRVGNVSTLTSAFRIAPSPPELVSPANGVTTNDRTPEFRWNASVGSAVQRYDVYVNGTRVAQLPGDACADGVCEAISQDLGPPFAPLKEALDWYVRAIGVDGPTKDSLHRTVSIDPTVPNAPTLTGGPVGVTNDPSPTFSWDGAGPHFTWQLVGAGDQVVRGPIATSDVQATILPALPNGAYKFEVRQAGPNLVYGAAAVATFTVNSSAPAPTASIGGSSATPPPAPSTPPVLLTKKATKRGKSVLTPRTINARLLRPKAGAKVRDVTPTLRWLRRPKGAKVFNIQIFRGSKKILSRFPTGQRFTVPPGVLKRGTRYIWRVWPYFGAERGYPKTPLGMTYLDVLKVAPRAKR
jgi:hypothetical protein